MTLPSTLSQLPDETVCYIPGVGETTVGAIRGTPEETPGLAERWETDVALVLHAVTRNLCLKPWESPGAGPPGGRA